MKTYTILLFLTILLSQYGLSQETTSGYYTYQTGATERIGKCLDLHPDRTFTLFSIRYAAINPIDSGKWNLAGDTIIFQSIDSTFYLKVVSEYNLQSFLPDSIDLQSAFVWLIPTHWTKTRSYYQNGQVRTQMSWASISQFEHEFIPHGLWTYYYENGNLKEIGKYKKGRKKGKWFYLWPGGEERNK